MRVWDLPLRLFHWGFALGVIAAIGAAKAGVMWAHERFGLLILALLAFRIIWGFVGGHHARFANFLVMPRTLIAWIKSQSKAAAYDAGPRTAGHSPLAGYSVAGLLLIPLIMGLSGIISNDGILFDGPLAHFVPALSDNASKFHHKVSFVLFAVLGLHIAAIIFYKMVKKQALTAAMVHGRASEAPANISGPEGHISTAKTVLGLVLMAALIAGAQMIILLRPSFF